MQAISPIHPCFVISTSCSSLPIPSDSLGQSRNRIVSEDESLLASFVPTVIGGMNSSARCLRPSVLSDTKTNLMSFERPKDVRRNAPSGGIHSADYKLEKE